MKRKNKKRNISENEKKAIIEAFSDIMPIIIATQLLKNRLQRK